MMQNWTLHYGYRAKIEEILGSVIFATVIKQPNGFMSTRLALSRRDVQNDVAPGDFIESPGGELWYVAKSVGTAFEGAPTNTGLNIKHLDEAPSVPGYAGDPP